MGRCHFRYIFFTPLFAWALSYEVDFIGLQNTDALNACKEVSQLISMQDRPPPSINGLRYRVASDIPEFLKVLKAYSFYDATITSSIKNEKDALQVTIFFHPGLQYTLGSYEVYTSPECKSFLTLPKCPDLTPALFELTEGKPTTSMDLVNAELDILFELSRCGYPLASIDKRRVVVDMKEKKIEAAACVSEGPISKFGPITFFGMKNIEPRFIQRKISWEEGEVYNSDLVIKTQERLLKTELFSSVLISHAEEVDGIGEIPMKVRITEAKFKKLTLGAFYGTVDGPGFSFEWRHRNVRGMGEIVSTSGNISKRYYSGNITYKKPDFLKVDQDYRALFEITREDIKAYLGFTYRGANFIEKKIDKKRRVSLGLKYENIDVSDSASNGSYSLFGLPLFGRYDHSNSLLNPTTGYTLVYSITPYQVIGSGYRRFAKQRVTGTFYIPLVDKWVTLALRGQVGSIAGAKRKEIPMTKLFLGGSEDDLRGYRYKTVSPLNQAKNKPLGGRSAIFTSVELRFRVFESIGIVPFADFGTVSLSEIPEIGTKWFKSVGVGARYYAFFGPLRFDIGFPLDKRKKLDSNFEFYASVGQSF